MGLADIVILLKPIFLLYLHPILATNANIWLIANILTNILANIANIQEADTNI